MEEGKPICSICLEILKDPRTISCNHVFCSGCLERHEEKNAREGSFACPLCNRAVTVSLKGVSGVADEATNWKDVSREISPKCDVCGTKISATSRCIDCEQYYCQVCAAMHIKIKALRNHTLRELGALDQEEKATLYQRDFCPEHPEEEIKIVCKTCKNIPLCLFCKISQHDSHKSRILAEEVVEVKSILEQNSTLCTVRLEQLQSCKKKGAVLDGVIDKSEQDEIITVNKQEQELIRLLEEQKQIIKNEAQNIREGIGKVYQKVRKENAVYKKKIEKEFSDCVTLQSEARTLIETVKDSEIVKTGHDLSKKLLEESRRTVNIKLLNIRRRAFTPAGLSKMQKLEFRMGDVSTDITSQERGNTIQLCLMFLTGQKELLEVDNSLSQTVGELKQRIQDTHGTRLDQVTLRLPFLGKELQDGQSLCNYYIHNGSTIEVHYKTNPRQEEDAVIKI